MHRMVFKQRVMSLKMYLIKMLTKNCFCMLITTTTKNHFKLDVKNCIDVFGGTNLFYVVFFLCILYLKRGKKYGDHI